MEKQINRIETIVAIILAINICMIIYFLIKIKPLIENANLVKIDDKYIITTNAN